MKAIILACTLVSAALAAPSNQVPYQTTVYGRNQVYDAVTQQANQVPYFRILPNQQNPSQVYLNNNNNNNLDQLNQQQRVINDLRQVGILGDQLVGQGYSDQQQRLNVEQQIRLNEQIRNEEQRRLLQGQNNLNNVLNQNLGGQGLNNINNILRNNDLVARRNEQLRVANQIVGLQQQQQQIVGPVVAKTRLTQSLHNVGPAGVVSTTNARLINDRDGQVLLTQVGNNPQQNLGQLQVDVSQGLPLVLLQNQQNQQAQRIALQQNHNGQVLVL